MFHSNKPTPFPHTHFPPSYNEHGQVWLPLFILKYIYLPECTKSLFIIKFDFIVSSWCIFVFFSPADLQSQMKRWTKLSSKHTIGTFSKLLLLQTCIDHFISLKRNVSFRKRSKKKIPIFPKISFIHIFKPPLFTLTEHRKVTNLIILSNGSSHYILARCKFS